MAVNDKKEDTKKNVALRTQHIHFRVDIEGTNKNKKDGEGSEALQGYMIKSNYMKKGAKINSPSNSPKSGTLSPVRMALNQSRNQNDLVWRLKQDEMLETVKFKKNFKVVSP